MKKALPTLLIGIAAVTLLDSLGAIASRQMNFNYSYLSVISFIIYVAIAFAIARRTDKKTAIISAGLLGLYDATVGWKLSMLLQANTGNMTVEITPTVLITTAIFMALFAALLGLLGWWLSTKFSQTK
jgi:fructose-specific phosphotransferase system IIC component